MKLWLFQILRQKFKNIALLITMGEIVVARGDEPTTNGVPWERKKEPSLDVKGWIADTFEKI